MTTNPPDQAARASRSGLSTLRRLARPLADRRGLTAALVLVLALAPYSVVRKGADEPTPDAPRVAVRPEFACLQRLLPPDATAVFFSRADGSVDLDSPLLLYLSQSQLAPRLLVLRRPETWREGDVDWFVGTVPRAEAARALAERHGLTVVGACGTWAVLGRRR